MVPIAAIDYPWFLEQAREQLDAELMKWGDWKKTNSGFPADMTEEERRMHWIADGLIHGCEQIREQQEYIKELKAQLRATGSVEQLTAALELHYGCVVGPIKDYCQAFDDWLTKALPIAWAAWDELDDEQKKYISKPPLFDIKDKIPMPIRFLDIGKSSYLGRRIYDKEAHRTEKCPVHKGRWSGLSFQRPECATPEYPWGCELTGWLPVK